jgi:hypothetical protein
MYFLIFKSKEHEKELGIFPRFTNLKQKASSRSTTPEATHIYE